MNPLNHKTLSAAALALLLAPAGLSQTIFNLPGGILTQTFTSNLVTPTVVQKTASYSRTVGDTDAGVQMSASGRVKSITAAINQTTTARQFLAEGNLNARGFLWGNNRELVDVFGQAGVANGDWTTTSSGAIDRTSFVLRGHYDALFRIRLGGTTRYTRTATGTVDSTQSVTRSLNLPALFSFEQTIWAGGFIPVTVGLDVGADASMNLASTLRPINLSATLGGGVNGYGYATARAAVGVACAQAGVAFDLRLLNTTVGVNLAASGANLSGSLTYQVNTVRILLRWFVNLCLGGFDGTIWDKSFGTVSGSRTLI